MMMLSGLQTFIAGYAGLIGLALGILVSGAAKEELGEGKRYFIILRDVLFLFAAGLYFYQYGFVVLALGLLLCTVVVRHLKEELGVMLALFMVILLILTSAVPMFMTMAGLFLLIGLVEGGVWASTHQQLLRGGVLRKGVWHSLYREEIFFFLLPLAGIIFLI